MDGEEGMDALSASGNEDMDLPDISGSADMDLPDISGSADMDLGFGGFKQEHEDIKQENFDGRYKDEL